MTDAMTGETCRLSIAITNPQGFHMRPMQAFVETACRFACEVSVGIADKQPVNGRSMWGLLSLGAEQGMKIIIETTGDGAAEALKALAEVVERAYDEVPEPPA